MSARSEEDIAFSVSVGAGVAMMDAWIRRERRVQPHLGLYWIGARLSLAGSWQLSARNTRLEQLQRSSDVHLSCTQHSALAWSGRTFLNGPLSFKMVGSHHRSLTPALASVFRNRGASAEWAKLEDDHPLSQLLSKYWKHDILIKPDIGRSWHRALVPFEALESTRLCSDLQFLQ